MMPRSTNALGWGGASGLEGSWYVTQQGIDALRLDDLARGAA